MTSELTRRAQELTDRAEAGPWHAYAVNDGYHIKADRRVLMRTSSWLGAQAVAEFVAESRSLVPALLDRLTAAEERLGAIRRALENPHMYITEANRLRWAALVDPVDAPKDTPKETQ